MLRKLTFVALCALALPAVAQSESTLDHGALVEAVVSQHILPGFTALAEATEALKTASLTACHSDSENLRAAFHDGFDTWMAVSHLRFGPTEEEDRAFALSFWPDTKGFTPKSLSKLIANEDPAVADPAAFAEVSVAARGFFALEQLLYDDRISQLGEGTYRCALVQAIANDIDLNADAILFDWTERYSHMMQNPKTDGPYTSHIAAVAHVFKALDSGLQFNKDVRLGRPLGTFDKPRPLRAEARRSGRSQRNVAISLTGLSELAALLSAQTPVPSEKLESAFALAFEQAEDLNDDPNFAGVAQVQGRFRVEILQQYVGNIRDIVLQELGPSLDVTAGFNALDGD